MTDQHMGHEHEWRVTWGSPDLPPWKNHHVLECRGCQVQKDILLTIEILERENESLRAENREIREVFGLERWHPRLFDGEPSGGSEHGSSGVASREKCPHRHISTPALDSDKVNPWRCGDCGATGEQVNGVHWEHGDAWEFETQEE